MPIAVAIGAICFQIWCNFPGSRRANGAGVQICRPARASAIWNNWRRRKSQTGRSFGRFVWLQDCQDLSWTLWPLSIQLHILLWNINKNWVKLVKWERKQGGSSIREWLEGWKQHQSEMQYRRGRMQLQHFWRLRFVCSCLFSCCFSWQLQCDCSTYGGWDLFLVIPALLQHLRFIGKILANSKCKSQMLVSAQEPTSLHWVQQIVPIQSWFVEQQVELVLFWIMICG